MITEIDISSFTEKLKATIQKTGRLGFTDETAKVLNLQNMKCAKFARDDKDSKILYLVLCEEEQNNSFRVVKSGAYFYLPTKLMFDAFDFDYINNVVMFDLVRMSSLDNEIGGIVYKMCKRLKTKKS